MGTLVTLCSSTFSVLILATSVGLPKFIVPNLPDLAIKTRRTSGDWLSQLDTLYLKGARQRTETVVEKPAGADAINWASFRSAMKNGVSTLMNETKTMPPSKTRDGPNR